ncbi:hypothetical protein SPI_02461 [Niveomyces insectorum RCEF 264]|uniref:Apple domain-containing protein n=1 Tax=Niveomyces insectorum RCEF 264 TaxID=1081102 RepID=A0A167Y0N0_9HYPO|nr:hypothetical protein SPI_02461 [Niveomyces insectorum RCEF 264]
MKLRRETTGSGAAESGSDSTGQPLASWSLRTTQGSGQTGASSLEMSLWPRLTSQPDALQQHLQQQATAPTQPAQQTGRSSQSSLSSQRDGRTASRNAASRNGSRGGSGSRPTTVLPRVATSHLDDGQDDVYFPLSPAPLKRPSDAATRLTRGSDSDILPPDDSNYRTFPLPRAPAPIHTAPHRIVHATASGPPSVYWSDDGTSNAAAETATIATVATSSNPSAYTFYREGTPTPLDDDDDDDDGSDDLEAEKREVYRRIGGGSGGGVAAATSGMGYSPLGTDTFDARHGGGGGGGGGSNNTNKNNNRHRGANDDPGIGNKDDAVDDGTDTRPDKRSTADFEFVNGRYVPPGLRNGRAPGRKPVSTGRREHDENGGGDGDDGASNYTVDADGRRRPRRNQRSAIWIVLVVLVSVLSVAIGVGVGLGVSLTKRNRTVRSGSTPAATFGAGAVSAVSSNAVLGRSTTATVTTATATTTPTAASSQPYPSSPTEMASCPGANGTVYAVPGSDKSFLRLCGVDYTGAGGAVDLSQLPTASMAECMNNCAGTRGCTGCGWGPPSTNGHGRRGDSSKATRDYQCYLKSHLGHGRPVTGDWNFGILQ